MFKFIFLAGLVGFCAAFQCENEDFSLTKVGCFVKSTTLFPVADYIANNRDSSHASYIGENIDWNNFGTSMNKLACECEKKGKEDGYIAIALGYYGECYGTKDRAALEAFKTNPDNQANDCIQHDYGTCNSDSENCIGKDNSQYIYEIPAAAPEPVNGGVTEWSEWTTCSKTCGEGEKFRERSCTNPTPQNGGADCEEIGPLTESESCNIVECPIDGGFTDWSDYSTCSVTCGGSTQTRTRSCTNPEPQHGGADCVGETSESQECGTDACPIDGGFTDWSDYSTCSVTCGGSTQTRTRSCTNPEPKHGGANCVGKTSESRACGTTPCPINGGWTSYGSYGSCSKTCGGGSQTRTRSCTNPRPQHGGANCAGSATQTQSCMTRICPYYTDFHANSVCEGGSMRMYCTNSQQVIKLDDYYWYGRTGSNSCDSGINWFNGWSTSCKGGQTKIYNTCQNKNECTVYANNNWMGGDPCSGTPKYYTVRFRCYGPIY